MIGRNIGNFVVLSQIGQGGMGVVYLAEHPLIGRQVAIKALHPHLAKQRHIVARFFTEARSAYEVRSANIVEILDFGMLEDETAYFVMEWLDGRSLSTEMERSGRLPPERATGIAVGIARALCAAHARGIVHRDLKPDNVFLVERDGDPDYVKVLDFGIAKVMDEEELGDAKGNLVMGTPAYMSPEQCVGDLSRVDHRSDIYSLGVMLYEMVTGKPPFGHGAVVKVVERHLHEPPVAPTRLVAEVPDALERVILRALEKDRGKRYQSAQDLLRELREVAATLPQPTYTPGETTLRDYDVQALATLPPAPPPSNPAPAATAPQVSPGLGGVTLPPQSNAAFNDGFGGDTMPALAVSSSAQRRLRALVPLSALTAPSKPPDEPIVVRAPEPMVAARANGAEATPLAVAAVDHAVGERVPNTIEEPRVGRVRRNTPTAKSDAAPTSEKNEAKANGGRSEGIAKKASAVTIESPPPGDVLDEPTVRVSPADLAALAATSGFSLSTLVLVFLLGIVAGAAILLALGVH